MKTNKIIAAVLLAVVATGCTKENGSNSLRLLCEPMSNGDAKVLFDPANVNNAQWVAGEQIYLQGNKTISQQGEDFYLDLDAPIAGDTLAVYPTTLSTGGNKVTLAANVLTIESLNIDFDGSKHHIIFPMAGTPAAGGKSLKFVHLTGGLKLTLRDTSTANSYTIGSLRITTYGDNATADPIAPRNGITACWAKQGLTVPGGMVGLNGDVVDAKYATQMDFTFTDGGSTGKAIANNGSISFCVPITASSVKALQITGFAPDGTQLFSRLKNYGEALPVAANNMYSIDEIKF